MALRLPGGDGTVSFATRDRFSRALALDAQLNRRAHQPAAVTAVSRDSIDFGIDVAPRAASEPPPLMGRKHAVILASPEPEPEPSARHGAVIMPGQGPVAAAAFSASTAVQDGAISGPQAMFAPEPESTALAGAPVPGKGGKTKAKAKSKLKAKSKSKAAVARMRSRARLTGKLVSSTTAARRLRQEQASLPRLAAVPTAPSGSRLGSGLGVVPPPGGAAQPEAATQEEVRDTHTRLRCNMHARVCSRAPRRASREHKTKGSPTVHLV